MGQEQFKMILQVITSLLLLPSVVLAGVCKGCETTPEPKTTDVQCGVATPFHQIVGGQDTQIEEHPWQIWMLRCTNGKCFACGGSIVSSTWIVSAAHCTAPAAAAP